MLDEKILQAVSLLTQEGFTIFPPEEKKMRPLPGLWDTDHVKVMRQIFDDIRIRRKTRGKIEDGITRYVHNLDKEMESQIRLHLSYGGIKV